MRCRHTGPDNTAAGSESLHASAQLHGGDGSVGSGSPAQATVTCCQTRIRVNMQSTRTVRLGAAIRLFRLTDASRGRFAMRDAPDMARRVLGLRRRRLEKLAPDRSISGQEKRQPLSVAVGVIRSRPKNGRQSAARFVPARDRSVVRRGPDTASIPIVDNQSCVAQTSPATLKQPVIPSIGRLHVMRTACWPFRCECLL